MEKCYPIGIFDSGVGGLTVAREIFKHIPQGRIVYFGDTAHVPYGPRSSEELTRFADRICQFLIEEGVQVIVDACNSTSAVALDFLQQKYTLPIIGVIEPGVVTALEKTVNGRIGVIATEATVKSGAHQKELAKLSDSAIVLGQACPLFVPMVEGGRVASPEAVEAARQYLAPLQQAGVDTVILGCTHYPFLLPALEKVEQGVEYVDPAYETVNRLKDVIGILPGTNCEGQEHRYYVSGNPAVFQQVGSRLMDEYPLQSVRRVDLDWGD